MSALTGNWEAARSEGKIIVAPVKAATTAYQGALLVFDGAGNVAPLKSSTGSPAGFAGVSVAGHIVGGGDTSAADELQATGQATVARTGAVVVSDADESPYIGQLVYGIDDNTVSGTAGTVSIKVGTIVEIPATGQVRIAFTGYVQ